MGYLDSLAVGVAWGMDDVDHQFLSAQERLYEIRTFNRKLFWIEESATLLSNLNEKIAALSNKVCLTLCMV